MTVSNCHTFFFVFHLVIILYCYLFDYVLHQCGFEIQIVQVNCEF